MTTPNVEIVMPYGVTMEGDGTNKAKPVTNPGKQIGDNVVLPVGPVRIGASWDGPQAVKVGVYRPGIGNIVLGTIPEKRGGGSRQSIFAYGSKATNESAFMVADSGTLPVGTRGTLEVYPLNFE